MGGAIVAAFGAVAAYAINTVSYLGLIGVLWRWKPDLPARTMPRENLATSMTAGVRYVALSPNIVKVLLRGFLFGLTAIVVLALLPLVARHLIGGDALVYSVLSASVRWGVRFCRVLPASGYLTKYWCAGLSSPSRFVR